MAAWRWLEDERELLLEAERVYMLMGHGGKAPRHVRERLQVWEASGASGKDPGNSLLGLSEVSIK